MVVSQHLMVLAMIVIAICSVAGSAEAWSKSGSQDCDYNYQNECTCIKNDGKNCGDCDVKCPTCSDGKCGITCIPGWTDSNKNLQDGCEANIKSDMKTCSKCGVSCQTYLYSSNKCNNEKCQYVCNKFRKDCHKIIQDGCETDVGQDVKNCGGCGVSCPTYPHRIASCSGGNCDYKCTSGWTDYDGKENGCAADVGKDMNTCGGCGKKCPCTDGNALPTCSNGQCEVQCKSGFQYDSYGKKCVLVSS